MAFYVFKRLFRDSMTLLSLVLMLPQVVACNGANCLVIFRGLEKNRWNRGSMIGFEMSV